MKVKSRKNEAVEVYKFSKQIHSKASGEPVLVSMSTKDLDEMVEEVRDQRSKDEENEFQTKQVKDKVDTLSEYVFHLC